MGVLGGVANAEIERKASQEDAGKLALAQIAGQPGPCLLVVLRKAK